MLVFTKYARILDTMKIIFDYLKPYRKKLVFVAILHAIATFTSLLMPYVMSLIVDEGITNKDVGVILISAAIMTALALISLVTSILSNKINSSVTTSFTSKLCAANFKKINSLSESQYSKIGSSGLLTRSTDDIFNLEGAASELVYTLVTVPIMLIGGTILSFASDYMLSLIFLVSVPPVLVFIVFLVKPLGNLWDKADEYIDIQNRVVRERLSGLRVIRAFNSEEKEHKRAKGATEEMAKYIIRSNVRSGYIEPVAMLLLNFATVFILWFGAARAEAGKLSEAGDVIAVIQYVALIANAVLMLSWTIAWLPKLKVSAKRISEVLNMEKCDVGADDEFVSPFDSKEGASVELCNVNFTYPDASIPTLYDVSMKIKKGENVSIIGGTGSGKSTLIKLLLAFYKSNSGEIYLNSLPYSELRQNEIRSAFSTALQKAMIFEGSFRDNINMGKRDAEDEEIMNATEDAELSEFINSHGEGLSYVLVGLGQNISGGQKQRTNISRALLKEASVYIFDDSFSALDYLTERKVQKKLKMRLRGKTRITVTQRVSTALSSDRIFVMERGRIVGEGTHEELLKSSRVYREIAISQLGKDALGGDFNG